eukprot:364690-Chlamydomonas_euryale.AAC.2
MRDVSRCECERYDGQHGGDAAALQWRRQCDMYTRVIAVAAVKPLPAAGQLWGRAAERPLPAAE